jgi:hypothetical protein
MNDENKISFTEAELTRISLNPGEVLCVKIISDDVPDRNIQELHEKLKELFPNNKAMIFMMPVGSDISLTTIQNPSEVDCGPKTCYNCNCGKKEN